MEELAQRAFGVDLARLAPVALLVLARVAPLTWIAPWLGWRGGAALARTAIAVALTAALTPLALESAPSLPAGLVPLALIGIREVVVGATFAIAVSAPIFALEWAGGLVDRWRGGPVTSASGLAALYLAAGVVLFVTLGGHRLALRAFGVALIDVPPGVGASAADLSLLGLGAARIVADALALALAFAAPSALGLVIVELTIGAWGRVSPGLRAMFVALPLRGALGLAIAMIGLAWVLPELGPTFARSVDAAADLVRRGGP